MIILSGTQLLQSNQDWGVLNNSPIIYGIDTSGSFGNCQVVLPAINTIQGESVELIFQFVGSPIGECTISAAEGDTIINILESVELVKNTTIRLSISNQTNWLLETFTSGSTGSIIISIVHAQLASLLTNSELVVGATYNITDRGLFLQALAPNILSMSGTRTMRIVKNLYYTPDTGSGILGVWNANVTPDTDDIAVWGGKVWKSLTGAVGTPIDDTALDPTDWELIPTTNDTYYFTKSFGCTYDIENDWVASQWDDRGNVFTFSWILGVDFGYTISPNDFSDWGNEQIIGNTCFGIYNNSNSGGIFNNSNSGGIYNNSNSGGIFNNSNSGSISNNSNSGRISNNSNSGRISNNSNAGRIEGITSDTTDIEYNTNNGDILTTVVGVITDPIVNK